MGVSAWLLGNLSPGILTKQSVCVWYAVYSCNVGMCGGLLRCVCWGVGGLRKTFMMLISGGDGGGFVHPSEPREQGMTGKG